jgi:GxxExxY protein
MPIGDSLPPEIEHVATQIVDAAYRVHQKTGPGLLESAYGACLVYELSKRGLKVLRQVVVPIVYDGVVLDTGLRIDLLVEDCVIVEIKAVEKLHPIHEAQVLTYLKLTSKKLGLLINFNVELIRTGMKRVILSRGALN